MYYLLGTLNFLNNDAAVPGLSRSQAYSNKIVLPPTSLIDEFDEFVLSIFAERANLTKSSKILHKQRNMLLSRLLSGTLEVENLDIHFPPGMAAGE